MSTRPASIAGPATEPRLHMPQIWIALAVVVAIVAVAIAVMAITGGSDAGPVGSDAYLCPRMGSPC